jgi:predicted transcriptional regulator
MQENTMGNLTVEDRVTAEVPSKATTKTAQRLTVNLPPALVEELKRLAEEEGVTMTEIIRRSLSAESFLRNNINAGNKLLIQEKGQDTPSRVVIFR